MKKYLIIAIFISLLGLFGAGQSDDFWISNKHATIGIVNEINPYVVVWGESKDVPALAITLIDENVVVQLPGKTLGGVRRISLKDFEELTRAIGVIQNASLSCKCGGKPPCSCSKCKCR